MKTEVKFDAHVWMNADDLIPVRVVATIEDYASAYGVPSEFQSRCAGRIEVTIDSIHTIEGVEINQHELHEDEIEKLELMAPNHR